MTTVSITIQVCNVLSLEETVILLKAQFAGIRPNAIVAHEKPIVVSSAVQKPSSDSSPTEMSRRGTVPDDTSNHVSMYGS